jgi:hypothetical protein
MPSPSTLFRVLNEFIVLLLGALMILLAVTRGIALPARPVVLMALGIALIYWGVRAWLRPDPKAPRWHAIIRSGSLALVGLLVLTIPLVSLRYAEFFLGLAGGVLVLRGILGGVLFARMS